MASNKKAQILAAVMCASSIFGSYTMVSAADATANVDKVNGKITATAKNNDNQQSTITLQGNNFNVSVGGAATSSLALKDGTFTLNSKNLKIDSNNGLRIYDGTNTSPTATITKAGVITGTGLTIKNGTTTLASLNNSGLIVNGTSNINSTGTNANSGKSAKSTVSYSSGVQDTVTNGAYKTTSTVAATGVTDSLEKMNGLELENKVSSTLNASGLTTTVQSKGAEAGIENINSTKNKTISAVAYNSVTDTVYDANGKKTSYSNVGTTSITDTVYANNGSSTLASSTLKKSTAINEDVTTESGSVELTANKITTNGEETTTLTSKLNLTGDSASLTSGSASVKVDNATGNVAITANQKGSQGYVTLSGKNVNLSNNTFSLKNTTTGKDIAKIDSYGLNVNGTGTSSIKSTNSTTGAYVKNEITSGAMTTTARGGKWPSESDNVNKTTSQVSATGVRDNVYDDGGQIKATSSVTTSGIANTVNNSSITNTVNDVNTGKPLADSRLTTSGISNTTTALQMTGTNAGNTMSTGIYQNNGGISATATKKDVDGNTIGTSTLSLGGNSASLKVGNYGFAVDSSNNVSITGNNATLSGNKLTLTDVTTGKTATLDTNGLSLKDANGTQIGGVSAAGAVSGTSLSIKAPIDPLKPNNDYIESKVTTSGVADTIKQGGFTRATSNVAINSIKDTIYTNDGKELSSSNISKSVSDATESGSVTLIANKITTNDDATTTTLTSKLNLTGDSATLTSGSAYVKADNTTGNVLFSGKNVSLSGSTFTLKDVTNGKTLASLGDRGLSLNKVNSDGTTINYGTWNSNGLTLKDTNGKTATLTTSGLTLKDEDGNTTGGISTTGAVTGTSLRITTSEDAGGNKTVSTVATNAVTDTVTNTKTNNKTTSQVSATGVRDTVYDANNKTVASSTVTTSGISNNTNISGIAIKDDKYNTKTMNTSIAQNANGVSISSNKYNVYNDGTNTVQTTDGTSTISVNGAKTTISGYGYKYEKDENGKPILDEKGNPIRSSYTNASLSVDGESGIIGLSGKNVGLSANGLTLYKDVEGVKTQYASLTAGGLNVNGTGYTTIKSTNATTGAMGQSQVSYNGVTDTVTNAAGNKTTSTVSATGTIDQVYDTDGKTRIAYSNVTTNGITDSFTKDGVTNSVTTNANGTTFASTGNGTTTIKGGSITTNSITVAGNTIDGGFFDTIGETNSNTAGIVRTEINGDWITSIEGAINISRSGNISLNADKLTYSYNDGKNSGTLGALANKVDDIYDRTQGIDYDKATGTTTIDGNLSVKDETTTGGTAGSTGETGTTPINGNITANTANIGGVQMGKNAVTATTGNFENITVGGTEGTSINKDGVTVGDKKSDNYTSITNNDVIVNNNGNKTSLADVGNRVTGLESSVNSMNNRLSDVEDRIDKVGAMSAAIANLRTMGFDPEAPTEIAIGVGQYKSETGLALGVFHYPNQDFMLSASISTSGDEVMGGIGATWKLGRKSAAEKAKDEEARRLEKAEEMKKLAQDAKVKAQAERHAKLLAEREAQKTA